MIPLAVGQVRRCRGNGQLDVVEPVPTPHALNSGLVTADTQVRFGPYACAGYGAKVRRLRVPPT